jgi:hypothetical protein
MESIVHFKDANQDDIIQHDFHFISGPGGTGKLALFKKLHAACLDNSISIMICAATSLAALSYGGTTMAYSLLLYPVEDETDVDDHNLAGCNFKQECCDSLYYEIFVIFWDELISNNCILMEAVLGVVQAIVGQKLVKRNKIISFHQCPKLSSGHCSNKYKCNTTPTPP